MRDFFQPIGAAFLILLSLLIFGGVSNIWWPSSSDAQDLIPQMEGENISELKCAECGMKVDSSSKFFSWAIDNGGKKFFCDIGDMLYYYRNKKQLIKEAYVRDFISGDWINARDAFYVKSEQFKTPMSWHIAAFRKKEDALLYGSPSGFDNSFDLLK